MYLRLIRPILFALSQRDAEKAHELALRALCFARHVPVRSLLTIITHTPSLEREAFGIKFKNPIGFAAGIDKQGTSLLGLEALGFGFGEVGTVPPQPQPGNPRPRLFRITEHQSLINAMGFNSVGAERVRANIQKYGSPQIPIGVNVGANKTTPVEKMEEDFVASMRVLYPIARYFTINISSPNTPGLRDLQAYKPLQSLLNTCTTALEELRAQHGEERRKPYVVKIAPDISISDLENILTVIVAAKASGIIIGNTTINRPPFLSISDARRQGGFSGPELFSRMKALAAHSKLQMPRLPIIAVGGISSADQAKLLLEKVGVDLIQVYTAFVYQGPLFPSRLVRGLNRM